MSYVVVTGCPAPERLAPLLLEIASEIGCSYNSIYRGTDARKLLEANGKHDQAWLFAHEPPGVANPPGRSTHELRSDGEAYAGPVGRRLRWWQCGIDLDDAHVPAFIRAASKRGWTAHVTYPGSAVEAHHINLVKAPKISVSLWWKWRPIRRGAGAKHGRGRWLVKRLRFLESPKDHKRYLKPHGKPPTKITPTVEKALERFQRDHHQKADGIAGLQTYRAVRAAYRSQKRKRAEKAKHQYQAKPRAKPAAPAKPKQHPAQITKVSQTGVELVAGFEGFRSKPYQDAVDVWTIGYGHTQGVTAHTKPWTKAHALEVLRAELNGRYAQAVAALGLPLNQNQFDAIVSAVYNLGPGVLDRGRSLGDALRAHHWLQAADALLLYTHAGGRELPGLVTRRKAERALFLTK